MAVDGTPLEFGTALFERLQADLVDVTAVKDRVQELERWAPTFPEVRFCKGCVLPIVSEVAYTYLTERFEASDEEVYHSLRCEGHANLANFYTIEKKRPGYCGTPQNRDRQPISKSGRSNSSTTNPDFCIWYSSARGRLRLVGEAKYLGKHQSSNAAVNKALDELRYYLGIESCTHSDWGHDFGFGVIYSAGGDQARKAELLTDHWESDRILIANFSAV